MKTIHWIIIFLSITECLAQGSKAFDSSLQPPAPDYSLEKNWSALPFREDAADLIPSNEQWISDSLKEIDVFFIHPTTYSNRHAETWNADVSDSKLNKKVDKKPIKYQASSFNQTARVYAPRYRQGHLDLYSDTTNLRQQVLDFAYQDVKAAFEYYLKYYNKDRPIVIASHSQGTTHSRKLLKEFFDTPEMKNKLVCAYIVGYAIYPDQYQYLQVCEYPEETNCFVTWSSFQNKHFYPDMDKDLLVGKAVVNPISWKTDSLWATSKTSILLHITSEKKMQVSARVKDDMLWVKTKIPLLRRVKNLHIVDYNLFWYNIRENIALRKKAYFNQNFH